MVQPKYHVFICTSCRINGTQKGFCFQKGSVDLVQAFMQEIEDRELSGEVVLNNTGCFGICDKGPIVVVYPEGVWYGNVATDDVERIFDEHFEGGNPVKDLMI
ncbi:2Fe-2S ferredoxin [Kineothrix sedimenti]|uniref:2Fe-2S ferredoxin n=1 Tax=Kineothrix sedimenti TaxID=3123317 RepID=A0ABZ3F1G5_9FIRM